MSKNTTKYFAKTANAQGSTAGTASTVVFTAASNGSKLKKLLIANLGSATAYTLYLNKGASDIEIYQNASPSQGEDIMQSAKLPKDSDGNYYINLESGWTVKLSTTGASITYFAYGEDY